MTHHLTDTPSWHQEVSITDGYPFYRPNFLLVAAILWFIALCKMSIWAVFLLCRAKIQGGSIMQETISWKKGYWTAILCMIITSGFAIIDDGIRAGAKNVQQRYFMVQLLFNSFDFLAQIFLLFAAYNMLFELMRWSSLRSTGLRSKYFAKFMLVRLVVCIALGVIALVLQGMSIAYLRDQVFFLDWLSTDGIGDAAYNVYLVYGILYWLAAMEVLVISGHMVTVQRKQHVREAKVYLINLFVTALPFFVAATLRVLGFYFGAPPLAMYANSDHDHTFVQVSLIVCAVLGPFGYLCTLGGIAAVARSLDTSNKHDGKMMGYGERLGSVDIVLMDRDPQAAHEMPAEHA